MHTHRSFAAPGIQTVTWNHSVFEEDFSTNVITPLFPCEIQLLSLDDLKSLTVGYCELTVFYHDMLLTTFIIFGCFRHSWFFKLFQSFTAKKVENCQIMTNSKKVWVEWADSVLQGPVLFLFDVLINNLLRLSRIRLYIIFIHNTEPNTIKKNLRLI